MALGGASSIATGATTSVIDISASDSTGEVGERTTGVDAGAAAESATTSMGTGWSSSGTDGTEASAATRRNLSAPLAKEESKDPLGMDEDSWSASVSDCKG